jgi:aminomethyltransferase
LNAETYWVVVNAANINKDFNHLKAQTGNFKVTLEDVSPETGLLALQGPRAVEVARKLFPEALDLKYYRFLKNDAGWIIARTGYTGEDGFEIFLPSKDAARLWESFEREDVWPIGLGARDTLRLEVGFSLYGHELSDELFPLETFSAFAVDRDHRFLGAEKALQKPRYLPIALVGSTPKPMRADETILWEGVRVGKLTSGSTAPLLRQGIGLGLVDAAKVPNPLPKDAVFLLESGGKSREAVLTKTPFVSTARVKGADKSYTK